MHVNQPVNPSYQGASRDQLPPPASGMQGGAAEAAMGGRVGRGGGPVVMRMSSSGVPTYYCYYGPQQLPMATSSPMSRPPATPTPPPPVSPIAGGPQSPAMAAHHQHHRQLPAPPSGGPFQFSHQQQGVHYGALPPAVEHVPVPHSPMLHHHHPSYGGIPAHPALVQQSHCFFSPPASPSPPRTPPPSHPMVHHPQRMVQTSYPSPSPSIGHRQVTVPQTHHQPQRYATRANIASGTSAVAIDNKIEQAMDLVKSHLMFAVREEVEVLKEKIAELMERINQLEAENSILKANASTETLAQLGGGGQAQAS